MNKFEYPFLQKDIRQGVGWSPSGGSSPLFVPVSSYVSRAASVAGASLVFVRSSRCSLFGFVSVACFSSSSSAAAFAAAFSRVLPSRCRGVRVRVLPLGRGGSSLWCCSIPVVPPSVSV